MMILILQMCATVMAAPVQDEDLACYLKECRLVAMDAEYTAKDLVRSPLTSQEFKKSFEVRFADAKYMSYYAECYSYTGGAHGMTEVTVGTLCRKTGQKVSVKDLVPADKMDVLKQALRDGAIQRLGGAEHLQAEVTPIENFYIAADGLHFVYNPYEIACYAKGVVEVTIPFKVIGR
jgi:hypothetical protein